jgi:hypothetical protein
MILQIMILQIINIFVAKINGIRKYKKLINDKDNNNNDEGMTL